MDRYGAAGLSGLVMLGLSSAALAADIPGDSSTQAVLEPGLGGVRGVFEQVHDSDWYRVKLKAGRNYAFWDQFAIDARLRDATGRVLASAKAGPNLPEGGFEFRPTRTDTYFVEFQDPSLDDCGPYCRVVAYAGYVMVDARGDRSTVATIKVGQTINGVSNYNQDLDYFRTRLERGKRYTVREVIGPLEIWLLDATGKTLFHDDDPVDGNNLLEKVKVPRTGTYYVVVKPYELVGKGISGRPYALSLTTP